MKGPGTESMCATRKHPQQRPIRLWLLPACSSSRLPTQCRQIGGAGFLPPRTIFYEESVLLKYFPLDASCVSRSWSCQLELMTVEKNTSKCCCDMAFGSGGARSGGGGLGGWQHERDAGKHPGGTRNVTDMMGAQPPLLLIKKM